MEGGLWPVGRRWHYHRRWQGAWTAKKGDADGLVVVGLVDRPRRPDRRLRHAAESRRRLTPAACRGTRQTSDEVVGTLASSATGQRRCDPTPYGVRLATSDRFRKSDSHSII